MHCNCFVTPQRDKKSRPKRWQLLVDHWCCGTFCREGLGLMPSVNEQSRMLSFWLTCGTLASFLPHHVLPPASPRSRISSFALHEPRCPLCGILSRPPPCLPSPRPFAAFSLAGMGRRTLFYFPKKNCTIELYNRDSSTGVAKSLLYNCIVQFFLRLKKFRFGLQIEGLDITIENL